MSAMLEIKGVPIFYWSRKSPSSGNQYSKRIAESMVKLAEPVPIYFQHREFIGKRIGEATNLRLKLLKKEVHADLLIDDSIASEPLELIEQGHVEFSRSLKIAKSAAEKSNVMIFEDDIAAYGPIYAMLKA